MADQIHPPALVIPASPQIGATIRLRPGLNRIERTE